MQKMGWFGAVREHSRSWAMPPFDRAHMTSYYSLIETMCLFTFDVSTSIRGLHQKKLVLGLLPVLGATS